eukprot:GCRY01005121.1.p1 GENE.GCRY01005121.1~~GCRY01005121.1.p1  ORF type:complete len:367 (-),score=96.12 GCRY01005121.1:87-1187(-)
MNSDSDQDLFGEEEHLDIDVHEAGEQNTNKEDTLKDLFGELEDDSEKDEEDFYQQSAQPTGETLKLSLVSLPVPSAKEISFCRIPNVLAINPKPFSPENYSDEYQLIEYTDEEGNKKAKYCGPNNTIRWRDNINSNGDLIRESNANFVTWSDGSVHLVIGNEYYAVNTHSIPKGQHFLYARNSEGVIECHGAIDAKMVVRPTSMQNVAHRQLTRTIQERHRKTSKMKRLITNEDPLALKQQKERDEEERIRARDVLERKRKGLSISYDMDDLNTHGAVTASLLEDEEEGLDHIKRSLGYTTKKRRSSRPKANPQAEKKKRMAQELAEDYESLSESSGEAEEDSGFGRVEKKRHAELAALIESSDED